MLNRIFLGLLVIAAAIVGFFYFYANSWLGSIGEPKAALEGFSFYTGISWTALWISAGVLLITANIAFWRSKSAWTIWATVGFFAIFVILRYFWLERAAMTFRETKLGADAGYNFSVLLGVVLIFLFAVIAFFDQYLSARLYERMYPPAEKEAEPETQPATET